MHSFELLYFTVFPPLWRRGYYYFCTYYFLYHSLPLHSKFPGRLKKQTMPTDVQILKPVPGDFLVQAAAILVLKLVFRLTTLQPFSNLWIRPSAIDNYWIIGIFRFPCVIFQSVYHIFFYQLLFLRLINKNNNQRLVICVYSIKFFV